MSLWNRFGSYMYNTHINRVHLQLLLHEGQFQKGAFYFLETLGSPHYKNLTLWIEWNACMYARFWNILGKVYFSLVLRFRYQYVRYVFYQNYCFYFMFSFEYRAYTEKLHLDLHKGVICCRCTHLNENLYNRKEQIHHVVFCNWILLLTYVS